MASTTRILSESAFVKSPAALALALLLLTGWAGTAFAVELTRGPYLQNASDRAITVRWRTDVATDSRVWVGAAPGSWIPGGADATVTTEHEVRLTGLTPDTRHFYAVGSSAGRLPGADSTYRFVTSPVPGTVTRARIWVLGDPGTSSGGQAHVPRRNEANGSNSASWNSASVPDS